MDLERGEMLDRDCNWALVEYKSLPTTRVPTSGESDPRTATTVILFEEFVPLEYRQQLAVTSSNRRRLPSLFSPGRKQWKQAATLNGRPYVVGHVPQSPSYQEVEFEGLLHGTTSTKLISLTKTPRVQSTVSTAPVELPLPPPPLPVKERFCGHLKGLQSELPPTPKSDDLHSDSTISPSVKKLFRLPSTPGSNRKSVMIPAQYSSVEFETRMASYSDDEHNGKLDETEAAKQKRRESRADAWVDILIGSQTRRIDGQDSEADDRRRGHRSTRSDPDIASLEVAQVLATVQNRSPSPPSMLERVDRDYGMDHHVQGLDVDEVEPYPRMSTVGASTSSDESEAVLAYSEHENADVESLEASSTSGLTSRQIAKHQRRVGYFDLHPDRRQAVAQTSLYDDEDEMRAKLGEDSDDDMDDERAYGPPEPGVREVRRLPVPPGQQVQGRVNEPSAVVTTVNLPTEVGEKQSSSDGNDGSIAPTTPSKTATLIEMYRERERGSAPNPAITSPAPLAPSRLPVRVTLSKEVDTGTNAQ